MIWLTSSDYRGGRIFAPRPPLIHTPLASVPSLVDTGHIWLRVLPAVVMLADICQISSRKSLDSLMLSVYWHFHVYMVTWV